MINQLNLLTQAKNALSRFVLKEPMQSSALRFSSFSNSFQHQLLPSAFKIVEYPTYLCWKSLNLSKTLWNRNSVNNWELFKNSTLAVLFKTGYFAGMVALPITIGLSPITLLADIITGIAECVFYTYKGLDKEKLSTIAHRKLIISPCQHFTFCLGAMIGLGFSFLICRFNPLIYLSGLRVGFISSLTFWSMGYAFGQKAVGLLPEGLNHESFNIFIGGGSGEGPNEQEKWCNGKWFNSNINAHKKPDFAFKIDQVEWNNFIDKEIQSLERIRSYYFLDFKVTQYTKFKGRLLSKCSPKDLMGLSNYFDQTNLNRKYRKLALIIHPDRNQERQQEATELFKVLQKANQLLSRHF